MGQSLYLDIAFSGNRKFGREPNCKDEECKGRGWEVARAVIRPRGVVAYVLLGVVVVTVGAGFVEAGVAGAALVLVLSLALSLLGLIPLAGQVAYMFALLHVLDAIPGGVHVGVAVAISMYVGFFASIVASFVTLKHSCVGVAA